MATNWQDTYEKLKKEKEALDRLQRNDIISTLPKTSSASTTSSKKKDDEEDKWFNTGLFDDGYDIGDISKTILGTAGDVGTTLLKGVSDIGLAGAKLFSGGVAQVADWIGEDEYAEKVRNRIAGKDEETNERLRKTTPSGWLQTANEKLDPYSIAGNRVDDLSEGVGQYVGMAVLQGVGVPWQVTSGVIGAGNELGNAYANGAEDWEAWFSAANSAAWEIATEYFSKGAKLPGTGKTLETLTGTLVDSAKNKFVKGALGFGINAAGEGLEEVASGFGSALGQKLSYMSEKEFKDIYSSEDAWRDFVTGTLVSGITMGASSGTRQSLKEGRNLVTGYTQNEQKIVDAEVAKRTEGQQLTSKQKAKIEAEVREDLEKGYITTDTIESVLGGDTYNTLKSTRDNKTNLENQIKELESKPNAEITVKEMEQLKALREELAAVDTNTLESKLQSEMGNIIKSDDYLQRSYQEKAKRSQEFTYETTEKDSQYRKGVMESTKGKLNDTTRSHETAEALVKLSEDRKMQYKFTNNAELTKLGLVPEGKTANGLYVVDKDGSREILVNTDSKKYIEAVLVHETAHDFQTTSPETYTKLQDITREFAEAQNEYSRVYSEVAGMYKNVEGVDINEEVTSRLLEDYLGNKDFINSLTTKEPSIVKKIIDEIKYLVKKFTAGSPEARKLLELQHTLEETYKEAYRQTKATETTEGTKYSLTDNSGRELSEGQQEYFKDSKARDDDDSLTTVYHTMTDAGTQFNEFNPVGTDNYRFGDKVVNYYTDSKEMSDSYARDTHISKADTTKLNSIEEAKKYLNNNFGLKQFELEIVKTTDGYKVVDALTERLEGSGTLATYANEKELLKHIKEDLNKKLGINQGKYQYEGYLNLTNPYVIDAEGRNWNRVTREYSQETYEKYKSLNEIERDYLMDLATWDDARLFASTIKDAHQWVNIEHKTDVGEDNVALASAYKKLEGVDLYDLYGVAANDFSDESMKRYSNVLLSTNGVVEKALKDGSYDGVIIKNVIDYGSGIHETPANVYVTFSSEQFKSYDNTNPTTDKDIRYSLSEDGKLVDNKGNDITLDTSEAGTHGTLMAIHNLTEGKMKGIIELGGFPVPSIAITNTENVGSNQFGDITVLFDKTTIDPLDRRNEVYDRDVWTPTFPTVEYDINTKTLNKIRNLVGGYGNLYLSGAHSILNNIEDRINGYGLKNAVDEIKTSDAFKYVYLKNIDKNFEAITKTTEDELSSYYSNELLREFAKEYGEVPHWSEISNEQRKEIVDKFKEKWKPLLEERRDKLVAEEQAKAEPRPYMINMINSTVETNLSKLDSLGGQDKFIENLNTIQKNNAITTKIDKEATKQYFDENINQTEYEKWVDEQFKDITSGKGIRNDKDLFTPSGNRRSFKSLHEPYDLTNIVKHMTKQKTVAGEEGFGAGSGYGTIQAQMSTKFKSIDEIRQYANERIVPSVEEHDLTKPYSDAIHDDMKGLIEYYKFKNDRYSYPMDNAGYALNDFAGYKIQNINNLKKALRENQFEVDNIPSELLNKIVDDINALRNIPTDYFEAKPQRAVGLNEAQAIVIPNYVDAEFKQQLQEAGLKYYEYDPNIEGDRQRVINQFDDLKFSLSNENDIAPTSTRNQTAAQDIRLQVEEAIAPLQEEITQLREELNPTGETTQPDERVDEYAPITEADLPDYAEQSREAFNTLDDKDSPQEVEEFAPIGEELTPTDSLFDTRDYEEVGSKKVNAYMYDNPEVKPYFQTAAREMLTDLQNTTRGERYVIGDASQMGDGDYYFSGTKRYTTKDIAELLDGMDGKYKYSYADIEKGLRAIINDEGAENNAVSKRIEFYLDKRLREGYTDIEGYKIPADNEYLDVLRVKGMTDYYNSIPLEEAPVETIDNVSNSNISERIAPLRVEAIRPAPDKDSHGYKMIRVKTDAEIQAETNEEIAEVLAEEPKTENTRNKRKWAILKANVLDKGLVFEDVSLKHKNRELMGKWDYTLTSEARGQNVIGNGHYEYDPYSKTTKKVSKSLNEIREQVDSTGLTKEFYEYMYHKHNIDRMRLDKTHGIENKPVFGYNVTADQSVQKVRELENLYPDFILYAQDVYDYLEADRNVLVENGVISEETAQLWKDMYPHYVPIRRAGHTGNAINVPLDTGRTGVNAPIKKATGGNQDILPLFDTMASRTLQTHRAAAKNSFGVELKNTIGTTINSQATNIDEVIDSVDAQEELLQEGKKGQKPTFTVFEDGEKITFEITQDMYDALKPLSDSSILSKTFGIPSNISGFHRGVLTQYNPVFMLTNAIKDAQDIIINSQHSAKTYAKVPEAFAQILSKGYWYQEYMLHGGEHNSYFDSVDNTFKTKNTGIKKILDLPPLKQIAQMNDFIEKIPRMAEYIASREAGRSIEVSMLDAARVTTNFKAGGNLTKFLNRNGVTFLNASVQGAMQQVRNVREANANGIRGWANLATKFAVAGLPAILLNALLWDDDEEYEELSDYVKQNYYIVAKNDDGTFIRIPKGRTLAVIQEGFEQMKHLITGDDEADLKTFLDLMITNLAPNSPIDNNVLSPIADVLKNKTWYDEDLVPTRLQDLPAAEQYDESTDSFSRWLGEKTNFSPMKINYLLDQYTGGVGDVLLPMGTPEAKSDADTFGEHLLAPLKSKFTTNAVMNNQNVTDFYDKSEELTTNAKKSTATDEDVLRNKYINSVKAEMNELYAEKREIQNSDLSNSEKYNRVLEVQKQINELSKEALNDYKNVDIYSNYATAGDRQYRLTDDGEWQKINDKQLEKQDDVTSSLGITPNDYWSNKEEYDYAYENPSKYALANAIADYSTFRQLSSELYDIKADKDESGKSISGSRKEKVFDYINNLDLDFEQRVMLAKLEYPSYDEYNYEIIEYLNEREDISREQMVSILTELGFTVKKDGTIEWD